jgi:preprotein translocase subunit SecF
MEIFKHDVIYDFMGARRQFVFVSFSFVVLSLILIWKPGPRWGTDFKGGTEIEVAFNKEVRDEQVRQAVIAGGFSKPEVIRVSDTSNPHHFMIRVLEVSTIGEALKGEIERSLCFGEGLDPAKCPEEMRAEEVKFSPGGDKISVRYNTAPDLATIRERMVAISGIELREGENNPLLQNARDNKVEIELKSKGDQLMSALSKNLEPDTVPSSALRVEWIGPKAGAQLRDAAFKSILIATIFIMVYIAFRFDLRFAPGAVIGLIHDVISTVGFLILLGREINLIVVAALLTIVGYSVNDTVIVYDRVRENLSKLRGSNFISIINLSLSEMLGRTILTNATVVFSMTSFLLWGTGALKDFALALIIGIVLGTYSSIYVALPLTHWLDHRFFSQMGGKPTRGGGAVKKKKASAVV